VEEFLQLFESVFGEKGKMGTNAGTGEDKAVKQVEEEMRDAKSRMDELEKELCRLRQREEEAKQDSQRQKTQAAGSRGDLETFLKDTITSTVKELFAQEMEASGEEINEVPLRSAEDLKREREIDELKLQLETQKLQDLQVSVMEDKLKHTEMVSSRREEELAREIAEKEKHIQSLEHISQTQEQYTASIRSMEIELATQEDKETMSTMESRLLELQAALAEMQVEKNLLQQKLEAADLVRGDATEPPAEVEGEKSDALLLECDRIELTDKVAEQAKQIELLQGMLMSQEEMTAKYRAMEISTSSQVLPTDVDAMGPGENLAIAAGDSSPQVSSSEVDKLAARCRSLEEELSRLKSEREQQSASAAKLKEVSRGGDDDASKYLARIRQLEVEMAQMTSMTDSDQLARELTEARVLIEQLKEEKGVQVDGLSIKKEGGNGALKALSKPAGGQQKLNVNGYFHRAPKGSFVLKKRYFGPKNLFMRDDTNNSRGVNAGSGNFVRHPKGSFELRRRLFPPKVLHRSTASVRPVFIRKPKGTFVLKKKVFTRPTSRRPSRAVRGYGAGIFARPPAGSFVLKRKLFSRRTVAVKGTFTRPPKGSFTLQSKVFGSRLKLGD